MRNALLALLVFALVLVGLGAISHSITFDIDYGFGAYRNVSAFWITVVISAVFFVVGILAAGFARTSSAGARRKVEAELQTVYKRLREAEATQKQTDARLSECEGALAEAHARAASAASAASMAPVPDATDKPDDPSS